MRHTFRKRLRVAKCMVASATSGITQKRLLPEHFGYDILHKEFSAPLLFTIHMFKSACFVNMARNAGQHGGFLCLSSALIQQNGVSMHSNQMFCGISLTSAI